MNTWISLLRGINVGGENIVPMKQLRELLEGIGCENVMTYIQSGNCVFRSSECDARTISSHIAKGMKKQFGFKPGVMTLSKEMLQTAIRENPYAKEGAAEPKSVHFYFLDEPATPPDMDALDIIKKASEKFALAETVFYLFAPEGIGRSRLAAQAEAKLGIAATGRNQRTVAKLAEMAS